MPNGGLFESPDEIERLAGTVDSAQGVELVPAFAGLGAPYFDSDARALLSGMSRGTTKAHIAHAALASIAQQDADILEIMQQESGYRPKWLFVDGGPTRNPLLMQMQADYAGCVIRSAVASELSHWARPTSGGFRRAYTAILKAYRLRQAGGQDL